MSSNLGHGRDLDDAPGTIGVTLGLGAELPPLPDDVLANPAGARLDPRRWFRDSARPFEIEIGSGKGTFLVNQAAAAPGTNYLGIEWAHEFYMYAADRLRRRQLANVRMLHADATDFLRWRLPDAIVDVIHLYFSDPWPKTKHHKRRVVQDSFLAQAHRVLIPGGELRIVTDHDEYWEWMEKHFKKWAAASPSQISNQQSQIPPPSFPAFHRLPFTPPPWVGEDHLVGTNYERKFKRDDRAAHAAVLRKPASMP
jgi:tRNA (guanine-N7-)-methyltransferase